jgi:predicted Zn finger-like uncharacterized protein
MEATIFSDYFDPSGKGSALSPSEQQRLDEAKHLYEEGKPGKAAPLFARLAEVLISNRQPKRAASLHAQAAQAFAESRNESSALVQARAALTLFLQYKMVERIPFFYTNIIKELTRRGMGNAAETLVKEFEARLSQSTPVAPPAINHLPANCPQCGAPVRITDAQGPDAKNVECAYCGTPIRPLV